MAMESFNNIIESIQNVFRSRDNKEKELQHQKESLETSIEAIKREIDSLSYKALIEEDKEAIKEHEALKVELDKKLEELGSIKEKIEALGKFEVSRDVKSNALNVYKEIQKEIDRKSKDLGKISTDYYKAKLELEKIAQEYVKLHREIPRTALPIKDVIDFINPEDIGMTEKEINDYKFYDMRDGEKILRIFEDNRHKYTDKNITGNDIHLLFNGTAKLDIHGRD